MFAQGKLAAKKTPPDRIAVRVTGVLLDAGALGVLNLMKARR
jgi:hypothetical protein